MSENLMISAPGSRRLSLPMLRLRERADGFAGAPTGSARPLSLLAAFQEAEPYLGLPPQAFKLIAWLVKMTKAQDWEAGSRPIAWPSAARQQEFLGLTASAVKTLNRTLFEAGVFVLRDSPTGKRYGRRDGEGRIVEAYGFDLSPLAFRAEEFIRRAASARAERERLRALRRRASCARRDLAQIGETLAGAGALPEGWPQFATTARELAAAARKARSSQALADLVGGLEAQRMQAEAWAREAPAAAQTIPEEPADRPLTITTNLSDNPLDTVPDCETSSGEADKLEPMRTETLVYPEELAELAPRLAAHLTAPHPGWRELVDAAGQGLRRELGVSANLWGEACRALGRQGAAVALAIVSSKPPEHFRRGAGGYFAAMVKRAATGELRLDRSLWKLRRERLERLRC